MPCKSEISIISAPAAHEGRNLLVLLDVVKFCQSKYKKTVKQSKEAKGEVSFQSHLPFIVRRHWEELLNKNVVKTKHR